MKNKYQLFKCRQDIGQLISRLHTEQYLAVGIMDTGTKEQLRQSLEFFHTNFNHVLHVISQADRCQAEIFQRDYPDVSFIIFDKAPSLAERLNAMADNCLTTFFFIIRSDCSLVDFNWEPLVKKISAERHRSVLCPLIFNKSTELVPTVRAPNLNGKIVDPLSFTPGRTDTDTLYPFLGIGFYDRALFQRLRGFDEEIDGGYWQSMDFGTRSWLFGYPIDTVNDFAVIFPDEDFMIEDRSERKGSGRFYTKALAVRKKNDTMITKRTHLFDRKVLLTEVRPKLSLYRTDYTDLCATWEIPKEE